MASARTTAILNRIANEQLRTAASQCLELGERYRERQAAIAASGEYTDAGRRRAMVDALAREFAPQLRRAQQPIVRAADEAKRRRAALALPAPDATNVVAALDRHAILAAIYAMPPAQRLPYAMQSRDMRVVEAVLSSPLILSGFTEQDFTLLRDDTMAKLHGPAIEEIAKLESAVAEASVAVELATTDLQRGSGLAEKDFNEIVARPGPNEVPWLKRDGDRVVVVQPGQHIYPPATADDLARGRFFANQAEYEQHHAAA